MYPEDYDLWSDEETYEDEIFYSENEVWNRTEDDLDSVIMDQWDSWYNDLS